MTCETRQFFQLGFIQARPRREEILVGQRFGFVTDAPAFIGHSIRARVLFEPAARHEFLKGLDVLVAGEAAIRIIFEEFIERVRFAAPNGSERLPAVARDVVDLPRRHVRVGAVEIQLLVVVNERSNGASLGEVRL